MAGRIPQRFIDDLITRTDIIEVIDSRVPLKRAGREYKACCPFHDEKTPSFTVSQEKQFYHCFGCGAHGTVIGFLMEYEHMDFVEAIEHLAARHGLEVPHEGGDSKPEPAAESGRDLLDVLNKADNFYRGGGLPGAGACRPGEPAFHPGLVRPFSPPDHVSHPRSPRKSGGLRRAGAG
jgi:DNA primase